MLCEIPEQFEDNEGQVCDGGQRTGMCGWGQQGTGLCAGCGGQVRQSERRRGHELVSVELSESVGFVKCSADSNRLRLPLIGSVGRVDWCTGLP